MDSPLKKYLQLPSLPTVAVRLLNMFADPDIGIADVVSILQTDPALSGKILRAANNSQFGLKKPVSDLRRAVVILGKNSVTALALGFSLAEASMSAGRCSNLYADFWFQSLVRGCSASLLADQYTQLDRGEAFTVGLLARIGRLALLNAGPDQYLTLQQQADQSALPLDVLPQADGGPTVNDITLFLLKEWKLPDHCCAAVAQAQGPDGVGDARNGVNLTDVVRIASAFGDFFSGENPGMAIARLYEMGAVALGETEQAVNGLVDRIRQELDDHSDLFSVDMSKVGSPMELLSQAMGQLSQIAVQATMPREEYRGVPAEMLEENGRLRKRVLELTQTAITDTLTGLFNRNHLMQQLRDWTEGARAEGKAIGLLFLDLDHFKRFNDTHGHLAGDEVLRAVAATLRDSVRDRDIVARYGGEEFVILTASADRFGLERQADRIRQRIESTSVTYGDVSLRVTASVGGSIGIPGRDDDQFSERLLETADSAMYTSKRNGRNRVTILDESLVACREPSAQLLDA